MLSSAQAFGFKKWIPRYIRDCNVLLSHTLCRQDILFCNIKSPAAGYKSALVARPSRHCYLLKSCEHNLGDHQQIMFVQYKTMTNCQVTQIFWNLPQTYKLNRNLTVAWLQSCPHNSSKYDMKIKYPKNMFLFTDFLFNFSHFHIKINPATKINNCFCSFLFVMCTLQFLA